MTHDILISVHLPICGIIEPTPFIQCCGAVKANCDYSQNTCAEGKNRGRKKIEREVNKKKT